MYQQLLMSFLLAGLFCVQGLGVCPSVQRRMAAKKTLPWAALPSLELAVALSLAPTDGNAVVPSGASSTSSAAAPSPKRRKPEHLSVS